MVSVELSAVVISADPLLRAVWAQGLRRSGVATVDESATLTDARARIAAGAAPHLIVLDARAGQVAALLVGSRSGCRVVMIGDPGTVGPVQASLHAGARGYLFGHPPTPPSAMPPTGHPVGHSTDPGANGTRRGRGSGVRDVHGTEKQLSGREVEILQHTADGESNVQIGEHLGLSSLTVKSHLSRIGRRLGSGDRAQLVMLAMRSGAIR